MEPLTLAKSEKRKMGEIMIINPAARVMEKYMIFYLTITFIVYIIVMSAFMYKVFGRFEMLLFDGIHICLGIILYVLANLFA